MDSLDHKTLILQLDTILDVEFTFINSQLLADELLTLVASRQHYVLDWTQRVASTNIELAHQFLRYSITAIESMELAVIEAWALEAMNEYDKLGLHAALKVIHKVDEFVQYQHDKSVAAILDDKLAILQHFTHGLSGRRLEIQESSTCYTDTEIIYLPNILVQLPSSADNFLLYKSMLAFLWAQTRFGTFQPSLLNFCNDGFNSNQSVKFLELFFCFETLRLEGCIQRSLPGLYRDMLHLKSLMGLQQLPDEWLGHQANVSQKNSSVSDVIQLTQDCLGKLDCFAPFPYQGELRIDEVEACREKRITREKAELRTALYKMQQEMEPQEPQAESDQELDPKRFELTQPEEKNNSELLDFELTLEDAPVAPPEGVKAKLRSILLDFGEIPDEYLFAAGPGEYDENELKAETLNPDDVWQGTYHEEGAFLYDEWDYRRQHYRKKWCAVREKKVNPKHDDFVSKTLSKYSGLIKHLRKVFEAMRDEDRLLKRQAHGDGIDIDALVEALADTRDGSEMSERLYTRMHRTERNIAVIFMVDMSGSTKGWINDAERECLILMSEALERLGDRYAIYGFSGVARKRCEIYKIKHFDEDYNADVKARISGIEPQDYTRMGFAIRHLTQLLSEVDARTRLLITLSDGKPDDYDNYRGTYGIQDTRRALIEARRRGVHPYCITIDTDAKEYLAHMYGAAEYTVIDSVHKLPQKISDIYRRLTT